MASKRTGLTYDDLLEMFPGETNRKIELIDGELVMPPGPSFRHEDVTAELVMRLRLYAREHGGVALGSSMDTKLTERDVVQPDVLNLLPVHARGAERPLTHVDLAVEVSSPSTRGPIPSASGPCTSATGSPSTGSSTWRPTASRSAD